MAVSPPSSLATQAEVDAQYNAAAAAPDAASYAPRWTEQARATRARMACTLDVAYGASAAETLDIFPAERRGAPVFVFLHGGYWRAFSSKEFSWVADGLYDAGVTTVVVDYALCPVVTIDEIVAQCRSAVAWTLREIGRFGGDPSRVCLGGHSAGGQLTAMCLQTDWARDFGLAADPLAAAVTISGVFDIAPLQRSYLQPQIRLDAGSIERNSPMFSVRRCATPLFVTWGENETAEFARQSRDFHRTWLDAGNRSELMPQTEAHHFSAIDGFSRADSVICRWLAKTLARSP